MIDDQQKLLDDLSLEYETILNERLDNIDALIADMIAEINNNSGTINQTIIDQSDKVGYELSESMKTVWSTSTNDITSVITKYGDNFTSALTTTNTALNNISTDVASMIEQLNKIAKTNVKTAGTSSAAKEEAAKPKPVTPTTPTKSSTSSGDGTPRIGDRVLFVSGSYYYDSYGTRPTGSQKQGQYVYITNINTKGSHPYHISTGTKLGSGDLGWLKLNQISGYATGKKKFGTDEVAWTQENGAEMIIRPSDGAILTPLTKGDSVLSATASNNIWDMANSPSDFIKDNLSFDKIGNNIAQGGQATYTQNIESVVFSLPNIMNYDQMLKAMQKDKNFENLILAMSVDRLAGKSSLSKNKSIR